MKIEFKEITVRDLVAGYADNQENGVVGYGGKLDIRPPYQREFIYKDKERLNEYLRKLNDFILFIKKFYLSLHKNRM
ncbi:MAG: hypothetical protein LBN11_00740 [Tannerella sp.]|jgi:hypothetical protein|nr:hypothetical protein [Tannerella sp.]